jgi:hypothetical protein
MNRHKSACMRASLLIVCLNLGWSGVVDAGYLTTVTSTTEPWQWVNGGLNSNYQFGVGDGTAPDVIGASSGISFAAGNTISITYVSGLVNAGFVATDANGDTGFVTNNYTDGRTGKPFPSFYFNPASYPAYLGELAATFTNNSGSIVGTPFAVGDSLQVIVPTGATQLQLGINDDYYPDNSGSFLINISGPSVVPEPSSMIMLATGLGGIATWLRRRAR